MLLALRFGCHELDRLQDPAVEVYRHRMLVESVAPEVPKNQGSLLQHAVIVLRNQDGRKLNLGVLDSLFPVL